MTILHSCYSVSFTYMYAAFKNITLNSCPRSLTCGDLDIHISLVTNREVLFYQHFEVAHRATNVSATSVTFKNMLIVTLNVFPRLSITDLDGHMWCVLSNLWQCGVLLWPLQKCFLLGSVSLLIEFTNCKTLLVMCENNKTVHVLSNCIHGF